MKRFSLPMLNLVRKPGRTAALMLLTAFLALAVFGGTLVMTSLRNGLKSMEGRLGADILIVPAEAESRASFKNLLLQGTVGSYYLDASALDKARETEGVETAAPQVFLASLKADCCSVKIQVIGFDPETDFMVQPWIEESYTRKLGEMELVVGCKVTADVGETLRIYDRNCPVVARLAPTGTGLDTAVYCDLNTMRVLLAAAEEKGVSHKITSDAADVVSAIYVKVRHGADIGKVCSALNGKIRKATAIRTASMITEVSDSLTGVSRTVTVLIIAVWLLALVILLIAFGMMIRERRREFAVLRLLGTSRAKLAGMVLRETALCSLGGGLIGVIAAAVCILPFTSLIEKSLGLPYLVPSAGTIVLYAAATLAVTVLTGSLSGFRAASRLAQADPGTTLREGA